MESIDYWVENPAQTAGISILFDFFDFTLIGNVEKLTAKFQFKTISKQFRKFQAVSASQCVKNLVNIVLDLNIKSTI